MRRISRGVALVAAVALAGSAAGPVTALEPVYGAINVHVQVTGYRLGDIGPFGGTIGCDGLAENVGFGIPITDGTGDSGPIQLLAGLNCRISEFNPGYAGDLGSWGGAQIPDDWVLIAGGATFDLWVTIDRSYNGAELMWDYGTWFPMEVFTVDRVYINRYGGVTAEGLAWCPALAAVPAGPEPIIGINWDATQYVGRKTAIHGSYGSDIGKFCFDVADPLKPVRWTSMHPSGTGAETAWVYGVDGKFASGTIRIDADSYNEMEIVTQWWDAGGEGYNPACSNEPDPVDPDGWYDANGDGFCAFWIMSGQRTTANLKTTQLKGK
jgi:hypothetical protein